MLFLIVFAACTLIAIELAFGGWWHERGLKDGPRGGGTKYW